MILLEGVAMDCPQTSKTNETCPVVLLISGWATSGKDAAASLLVEEADFLRIAFADALKEDVARTHFLPIELFHDPSTKDKVISLKGVTPRKLLLDHAKRARAIDPDVFARAVANDIQEAIDAGVSRIVISDWRYMREYDFLYRELLGVATIITCRITRHGVAPSADPSEHDLDTQPMHAMIDNDGSIRDLLTMLKAMLRVQGVL